MSFVKLVLCILLLILLLTGCKSDPINYDEPIIAISEGINNPLFTKSFNSGNNHEYAKQRLITLSFNNGEFKFALTDDYLWQTNRFFYFKEGSTTGSGEKGTSFIEVKAVEFNRDSEDFHSTAKDFIDIMNSLEPVLIGAVSLHRLELGVGNTPFEPFDSSDFLYLFQVETKGFFYRLKILEGDDQEYGLLYFYVSEYELTSEGDRSYLQDHTDYILYRITYKDLSKIISFAEGLKKYEEGWVLH